MKHDRILFQSILKESTAEPLAQHRDIEYAFSGCKRFCVNPALVCIETWRDIVFPSPLQCRWHRDLSSLERILISVRFGKSESVTRNILDPADSSVGDAIQPPCGWLGGGSFLWYPSVIYRVSRGLIEKCTVCGKVDRTVKGLTGRL